MFDDDGRGGAPGAAAAQMACELIRVHPLETCFDVSSQRTAGAIVKPCLAFALDFTVGFSDAIVSIHRQRQLFENTYRILLL
jgi:hypothetical protein